MHLHSIHHVYFEGLGLIADWADARGCSRSATWQHRGDPLPNLENVDLLCIMGGPMSVGDETEFPWLKAEKHLIREALQRKIPTLGICLGAQLIAAVSGAPVAPMGHKEIGWFPVRKLPSFPELTWMHALPEEMLALHWHGDQFEIPDGAAPLWSSDRCPHQGFALGSALGLQFHLEMNCKHLAKLIENAGEALSPGGPGIQSEKELLTPDVQHTQTFNALESLLDGWLISL